MIPINRAAARRNAVLRTSTTKNSAVELRAALAYAICAPLFHMESFSIFSRRPLAMLVWLALLGSPIVAWGKMSGPLINERREILVMSNGKPARLKNNPAARNRPLAEVLAFVAQDRTNRSHYVNGRFMCTEYAVALHDRAEAAGIRCALVSLSFTQGVGHALNAFQTTDRGLIYIDCTGGSTTDAEDLYDTFGYIEIGKPYGRLHVSLGSRWPSNYKKYEEAAAIFRNLNAWDRELAREIESIQLNAKSLEARAKTADRRTVASLKKSAEALQQRVDKYNQLLEYRNEIAQKFRVQYGENSSAVSHVDVFW